MNREKAIEVVDLTKAAGEWADDEDVFDALADAAARLTGAALEKYASVASSTAHVAGRLFERPLAFPRA